MGNTAENVVRQCGIPREDSDQFAFDSQMKAKAAMERDRYQREIVPVELKDRKGKVTLIERDEHLKPDTTMEGLAQMKPVFDKEGTVTAGNASGLNDCGAALVLMSEEKAKELQIEPLAEIVDYAVAGLDPNVMGLGPVYAIEKLLKKTGLTKEQIDVYQINEAFAGQMPPGGSNKRPLGISCYEDKLVENRVAEILSAIYEPKFYEFSYGFRPGKNCHQAVKS